MGFAGEGTSASNRFNVDWGPQRLRPDCSHMELRASPPGARAGVHVRQAPERPWWCGRGRGRSGKAGPRGGVRRRRRPQVGRSGANPSLSLRESLDCRCPAPRGRPVTVPTSQMDTLRLGGGTACCGPPPGEPLSCRRTGSYSSRAPCWLLRACAWRSGLERRLPPASRLALPEDGVRARTRVRGLGNDVCEALPQEGPGPWPQT